MRKGDTLIKRTTRNKNNCRFTNRRKK